MHHAQNISKLLFVFGWLTSIDLLLTIVVISLGIHSFKAGSFFQLGVSAGIYLSLNLVFFFWYRYGYDDYPTQIRRVAHPPGSLCSMWLPREAVEANPQWLPSPLDPLDVTVMTSNTLGPPENHSVLGSRLRGLQLMHSFAMPVLLVIMVSRAINTLS